MSSPEPPPPGQDRGFARNALVFNHSSMKRLSGQKADKTESEWQYTSSEGVANRLDAKLE